MELYLRNLSVAEQFQTDVYLHPKESKPMQPLASNAELPYHIIAWEHSQAQLHQSYHRKKIKLNPAVVKLNRVMVLT